MKWPRISVVTPSYNQSEFIEQTIQSVLNQKYPNVEYIIIDGGSTDGSVEIIQKYEKRLAYWVSEPDNGQTHALNKGFERATGDIVAWVNSDDVYCEGAFEQIAKEFSRSPNLDLVFGDTFRIDEKGKILKHALHVPFWWRSQIILGMVMPQPCSFWKRDLFKKYGYLDESKRFAMDYEFFCRIGEEIKTKYIRRDIVCFRSHAAQKTETIFDVCLEESQSIRNKYLSKACGMMPKGIMKVACLLHKLFWHLYFMDIVYIARGIVERLKGKIFSH